MVTVMERDGNDTGDPKLFGLPVDRDLLFSDHKGRSRRGIEKRQTKLVGKLAFLKPFLEDDEKIVLVTTGCSPTSVLEQVVTGWIVYYLKRSLIVFTNRRIFHVPAKSDFAYRDSIAEIRYPDCRAIALKRSVLEIRYGNGTREKFLSIDRRERKRIKEMLPGLSLAGEHHNAGGRTHLCPRCTKGLVKDEYVCPSCRLAFKNLADARRISILYPGGGYFYTGHPVLGIGDAITELVLMVLAISSLVEVMSGNGAGYVPLAIWGGALIVEKAISVYHSNHFIREYIPKEKTVRVLGG